MHLNPTLSAPLTYTALSNSSIEEATGNGTITATSQGTVLFAQVINVNSVFAPDNFLQDFLSILGITIQNVSDQIVLCGTPITANVVSFGNINFKEY